MRASLPSSPTAAEKVVFATSLAFQGQSIGGVSGADRICVRLAAAAGLSGPFRAWISGSIATSPVGRFAPSASPFVLPNGQRVADDWADLTTCDKGANGGECLRNPINVDERGAPVSYFRIWTGTSSDGVLAESIGEPKRKATCNDWHDDPDVANLNDGVAGRPNEATEAWTGEFSAGQIARIRASSVGCTAFSNSGGYCAVIPASTVNSAPVT